MNGGKIGSMGGTSNINNPNQLNSNNNNSNALNVNSNNSNSKKLSLLSTTNSQKYNQTFQKPDI
jgi:hypothetical protein